MGGGGGEGEMGSEVEEEGYNYFSNSRIKSTCIYKGKFSSFFSSLFTIT